MQPAVPYTKLRHYLYAVPAGHQRGCTPPGTMPPCCPCLPAPHPASPRSLCAHSISNDEDAKTGRVSFRGHAHSHATGPDEHAYQLDLELYGEVDDKDIKQVGTGVAAGEVVCA